MPYSLPSSLNDNDMVPQLELRASDAQVLIWNKTKDTKFFSYLWSKVFTTDQRVSLWNRLEIPNVYLKALHQNQDSQQDYENQNQHDYESQEQQDIEFDKIQITKSNKQIMNFIDVIFVRTLHDLTNFVGFTRNDA